MTSLAEVDQVAAQTRANADLVTRSCALGESI